MSTLFIKFLLMQYLVIMAICLGEQNWAKALYWFGASLLQVSILWGFR